MKKTFSYGYANFIKVIKTAAKGLAPEALASTVVTAEDNAYAFRLSDFKFAAANAKVKLAVVKVTGLDDPSQGVIKFFQIKTKSWVELSAGQALDVKAADLVKGYLVYEPPKDQFGASLTNFQYAVSTNGKSFSQKMATMTIDVTPVNDAPIAKNSTLEVVSGEKQVLSISDFQFQDVDNTSYSGVQFTKLPVQGSLEYFNVVTNTWESVKLNQMISADDIQAKKLAFVTPADAGTGNFTTLAFKVIDPGLLSSNEATLQINTQQIESQISGQDVAVLTEDTNVNTEGFLVAQGTLKLESSYSLANLNFAASDNVATQYGKYTIDLDGKWVYSINNTTHVVQQLGINDTLIDSFNVTSQDGRASKVIMVTISGMNDLAFIEQPTGGLVTEDTQRFASGTLTVHDADFGEQKFEAQSATVSKYGTFSIDASGVWRFVLDNNQKNLNVQSLAQGESVVDSFRVKSFDNTAESSINITITGTNDRPLMDTKPVWALTTASQPYIEGFRLGDFFKPTDIDKNSNIGFRVNCDIVLLDLPPTIGNPIGANFYHVEYSNDNGVGWVSVNEPISIYADENTRFRLMPNDNNQFDQGFMYDASISLNVNAWDQTSYNSSALSLNSKYLFILQSGFNNTPSIQNTDTQILPTISTNASNDKNIGLSVQFISSKLRIVDNDFTALTGQYTTTGQYAFGDKSTTSIMPTNVIWQNANGSRGLAITGLQSSYGKWQFSLDGGKTWQDISNDVNDTNALLLRDQDKIRYLSNPIDINGMLHYYADDASITIKAWDRSIFNFTGDVPSPTYMDTTQEGYAICSEDMYRSDLSLQQISDQVLSITDLLQNSGSSAKGLALSELPTLSDGLWQYSLDGGVTWDEIQIANLSIHNSLLLQQGDLLRFTGSFSAEAELSLTFREWYMNVANHGDYLNVAVTGSPSPFSSETVTFDQQVTGEAPPSAEAAATASLSLTDILDACPHVINADGQYSSIDLGSGSDSGNIAFPVTMNVSDVLHLSPDHPIHQLLINGDANDQVTLNTADGSYWSVTADQLVNMNSQTYVKYVGTYQGETVEVLINTALSTSVSGG